ncbi:MAG: hypothetical protein U5L45_01985 [Saprospiraceae bacterium]|nr:hypothetical protein [Saprospiraceae bacterium]
MKKNSKSLLALLFILVATATSTFAQREETLMGSTGFGFSGAWGGFTTNVGQFNGKYAGYQGSMWALEFGKRFFIGGTHYSLGSQLLGNTTKTYSMNSNNLLLGFTPKAYMPVHPMFSLGVGGSTIRLRTDGTTVDNNVFMLHPAVGAELNITRWCHLDAQIGYRAVMNSTFVGLADKDFSGMYGQVNLKFGYSWGRHKPKRNSSDKL